MEVYGLSDVLITIWVALVGSLALNQGIGIWKVSGGLLARALACQLISFGVWAFFILGEGLYQWYNRVQVSHIAQVAADCDRLILTVPLAVIIVFVIPTAATHQQHK